MADSVPPRRAGRIAAAIRSLIPRADSAFRGGEQVAILADRIMCSERIVEEIRPRSRRNDACIVVETMLRFNRKQRTAASDSLRQVANLALGVLTLGQLVSGKLIAWPLMAAGIALWVLFLVCGIVLLQGED